MPEKTDNWAMIRVSGRCETPEGSEWYSILEAVGREKEYSGSNWDRPDKLLKNGMVVVDRGLADVAGAYVHRLRKEYAEAAERARAANAEPEARGI